MDTLKNNNQLLKLKDTTTQDKLFLTLSHNTLHDLSSYDQEELSTIVMYSINDELVAQARKLLRNTNHNSPLQYIKFNNQDILNDQLNAKDDNDNSHRNHQARHTKELDDLKEDYHHNLQLLKKYKRNKGSLENFQNSINLKKEIDEQLETIKQKTYHNI